MFPVTIKGQQYFSLNEIAIAITSAKIRLSDVPNNTAEPKSKSKSKSKSIPVVQPKPYMPLTVADIKDRILWATLTRSDIDYRFTPKWPYVIVPAEILDLPLQQQRSMVRKSLDKMKPLWEDERRQNESAFMIGHSIRIGR